jgi:hypothetical protein
MKAKGGLKGVKDRLADHKMLKDMVYHVFYGNPIEHGSANLAIAIERYALGQPLVTEEEKQRAMLDSLSAEDRAAWWRARNAEILSDRKEAS